MRRTFAAESGKDGPGDGRKEGADSVAEFRDPEEEALSTYFHKQKPVGVVEGTSYGLLIVAGLGVALVAAWAVVKELLLEPAEYRYFNEALEKVREDPRVTVRLGQPISGYGQEAQSRSTRQRIPHKVYNAQDGKQHTLLQFQLRGPAGHATVHADCYVEGGEVVYTYLIVDVIRPMPQRIMLIQPAASPAAGGAFSPA